MVVKTAKNSVKSMKAVKKTAKKAIKTTHPRRPRMTLEEFIAATEKSRAETDKVIQRTSDNIDRLSDRIDKVSANVAMVSDRIDKVSANVAMVSANVDRVSANVDRVSANIDRVSDRIDGVSENVGGVNRRLGQIIEFIIVPYLRLDLNAKGGHNFEDMRGNRKVNAVVGDKKNTVAEMDIFLYGPAETMAVEIKTHLKRSDVVKHLERLKTLRLYETEAEINGKKLFGGVIGVSVDDDARKFAKKNGLYVIGIHEREDKLLIDAPEQRREW